MFTAPPDTQIKSLLAESTTIAVVGMSPKSERPSNSVAVYLMAQGYRVIPVNPGHGEILGLTCYPDLDSIPESVDIVDVFRGQAKVFAQVPVGKSRNAGRHVTAKIHRQAIHRFTVEGFYYTFA